MKLHSVRTLLEAVNKFTIVQSCRWCFFYNYSKSVNAGIVHLLLLVISDFACVAWKRKKKLQENQLNGILFNACIGQLYLVIRYYFFVRQFNLFTVTALALLFLQYFFLLRQYLIKKSKLTPSTARLTRININNESVHTVSLEAPAKTRLNTSMTVIGFTFIFSLVFFFYSPANHRCSSVCVSNSISHQIESDEDRKRLTYREKFYACLDFLFHPIAAS